MKKSVVENEEQVYLIEVDGLVDENEEITESIPSKPFIVETNPFLLLHIGRYLRPRKLGRVGLGLSRQHSLDLTNRGADSQFTERLVQKTEITVAMFGNPTRPRVRLYRPSLTTRPDALPSDDAYWRREMVKRLLFDKCMKRLQRWLRSKTETEGLSVHSLSYHRPMFCIYR